MLGPQVDTLDASSAASSDASSSTGQVRPLPHLDARATAVSAATTSNSTSSSSSATPPAQPTCPRPLQMPDSGKSEACHVGHVCT